MSDGPLSPEEVAHRGFSTAFRGFDTGEVRAYLQRVANELRESTGRERELNRRLADAEHRAAHPVIEGDALTRLLGEEMARILATAQEAAGELRAKAEDNAARILREAHEQAQRIRAKAEVVLAERSEEADGQAAEIRRVAAAEAAEVRRVAAAEAASVVDRARLEAADVVAGAEARAREAVDEAQAVRGRVLGDLTRRRRLLQMQVETLRAGRERLLDAYRLVRRSVDEVADELQRAETEARQAATAAADRAGAELDAAEVHGSELEAGDEGDGPTAATEASLPAGPPPQAPGPEAPGTPAEGDGPTAATEASLPAGPPPQAPGSPAEGDAGAGHRTPQLRLVSSSDVGAGVASAGTGAGGEEVRVIATRPGAAASSARQRRPAAGAPEGPEAPGRGEARRPAAGPGAPVPPGSDRPATAAGAAGPAGAHPAGAAAPAGAPPSEGGAEPAGPAGEHPQAPLRGAGEPPARAAGDRSAPAAASAPASGPPTATSSSPGPPPAARGPVSVPGRPLPATTPPGVPAAPPATSSAPGRPAPGAGGPPPAPAAAADDPAATPASSGPPPTPTAPPTTSPTSPPGAAADRDAGAVAPAGTCPTPPPAAATDASAPAAASGAAVPAAPPAGGPAPPAAVDELFARIRAGRADAVAKARDVLGGEGPDASAPPEHDARSPSASASPVADEALLERRDVAVEGLEARLARKLKRALQDEQNELLDRLRSARSASPDAVLAPAEDQVARYRRAAEEVLRAAADAGASFAAADADADAGASLSSADAGADADADARPGIGDVVRDLASSVAEPLRRALDRAIRSDAGAGDPSAVVERIGAVYRECKAQRLEGLAGDAVTAAFSRGALAGIGPGRASRWVVDDGGRPCPDCDDNALAGPTPPGEAFPTGQAHPPAHAGCRCLLAPTEVAAAVNGSG